MRCSSALLFLLLVSAGSATAQSVVLTGATVYDGTGGPPLTNAVIRIEGQRIACIGTADTCPVPAGSTAIDLRGRFVSPGLVDAHVHFAQTGWVDGRPDSRIGSDRYDYEALQTALRADQSRWHRAYLCSGVTSVFDPGGLPWTLQVEAAAEDHPERVRVRAAGPLITHFAPVFPLLSALGTGTFLPMQTDAEAAASVRELAELGARAVKVWYLDPPEGQVEALDARLLLIGREARARGLPLIVHATELRNAKLALRAGASMLVHSVDDVAVDDEFLRLARESGVVYAPTLIVARNWRRAIASVALGVTHPLDDPNGCVDAETRRVIGDAPALQATLPAGRRDPAAVFAMLEAEARSAVVMEANLRRVHGAGIPIVTATDAGNPLTVHGPSIYAEMEAMERAGLPAPEILVMSTRNSAAMMGRLGELGTLEAGKLADLIVLTEDPGAATRAFRSITHVMRGGRLHEIAHFAAR